MLNRVFGLIPLHTKIRKSSLSKKALSEDAEKGQKQVGGVNHNAYLHPYYFIGSGTILISVKFHTKVR